MRSPNNVEWAAQNLSRAYSLHSVALSRTWTPHSHFGATISDNTNDDKNITFLPAMLLARSHRTWYVLYSLRSVSTYQNLIGLSPTFWAYETNTIKMMNRWHTKRKRMKGMKNVSLNIVTQVALTEPSGTYSLHSVVPSEPVKATFLQFGATRR